MVSKLHYFRSFNDFLRWVRSMGYTKREAEKYWRGTGYYYHRGRGYFCKYGSRRGFEKEHYDGIRFKAHISQITSTTITIVPHNIKIINHLKNLKGESIDIILIMKSTRSINNEETPEVHEDDINDKILMLYEKGYSIKQIARELGLSYHTVYYRLRKLLGKNKK